MQLHKLAVLAVVFCLLSAGNPETRGGEAITHSDIEFANVDGHSLKLDLHLPIQDEKPRVVVWMHGGGWRAGHKQMCDISWLVEYGYAVASISYRLSGKAIFPAQIHDCKAAVRWLRANGGKYGCRTDKIAVAGRSAGGHLALLLGTTGGVEELEGNVGGNLDQSSRADAIIDYYGATDFIQRTKTQPHKTIEEGGNVRELLGGPADKKVDLAKLASPVFHLTKDDPPLLIFHGNKDAHVFIGQSERMVAAYRNAGLPVTFHVLDESAHGGLEFHQGEQRERAVAFLKQTLAD
jgi:acetyl esterase/lipase